MIIYLPWTYNTRSMNKNFQVLDVRNKITFNLKLCDFSSKLRLNTSVLRFMFLQRKQIKIYSQYICLHNQPVTSAFVA